MSIHIYFCWLWAGCNYRSPPCQLLYISVGSGQGVIINVLQKKSQTGNVLSPSVADPCHRDTNPDPGSEKFPYGSGSRSRLNFDTDPGRTLIQIRIQAKTIRIRIQAKQNGSGFSPTFDTDPDPGKVFGSGGSGSATLVQTRHLCKVRSSEKLAFVLMCIYCTVQTLWSL